MQTTVFASAARTATPTSVNVSTHRARALVVVIDVTAIAATPSVVFTVTGVDTLSGKKYTMLASAAITGTGTTILRMFPGATAAANLAANDVIPDVINIAPVHGDADSITYTVAAHIIK